MLYLNDLSFALTHTPYLYLRHTLQIAIDLPKKKEHSFLPSYKSRGKLSIELYKKDRNTFISREISLLKGAFLKELFMEEVQVLSSLIDDQLKRLSLGKEDLFSSSFELTLPKLTGELYWVSPQGLLSAKEPSKRSLLSSYPFFLAYLCSYPSYPQQLHFLTGDPLCWDYGSPVEALNSLIEFVERAKKLPLPWIEEPLQKDPITQFFFPKADLLQELCSTFLLPLEKLYEFV